MIAPTDQLPLGHDGYLKLWALGRPVIAAEYILLDGAQDSNPAVLGVLAAQRSQIVYVGDRHQQIYEWRGAVNAMDRITSCREAYLTRSFRFGPAIAAAATAVIEMLGETKPLEGNPAVRSSIGPVASPSAILARTNAGVMTEVIGMLDVQRTPHLVGGVNELLRLLDDVTALKAGQPGSCPEFIGFSSWDEVVQFAESEEGESLRMFVQLVQRFGELHLLWALRRVSDSEARADVVISTAHKAKGREWDTVRLSPDFASTRPEKPVPDDSERRLFYVAMTRAKQRLDVSPEIMGLFTGTVVPQTAEQQEPVARAVPTPAPLPRAPSPATARPSRHAPPIRTTLMPPPLLPTAPALKAQKLPPVASRNSVHAASQKGLFRKLASLIGLN